MNTEEKLQVLAALLEENCSAVRIKDGCMLFQGKKALFGILLLKTIYRDDDNKITSFRMQWLEKGAVDGPEADVAMAQNRLIENLQKCLSSDVGRKSCQSKAVCPHCTPSTAKPLQAAGGIRGRVHYKTRMAHRPE